MKYKNNKAECDGRVFDSQKEMKRYLVLKELLNAGIITNLECQKKYVLIPSQYRDGKCIERECSYKADFVYKRDGKTIVEDVKGFKTDTYKVKKKLMLYVHDVQIKEI